MLASQFTVFADACVLAGVLKRNLLLSLAKASFFRIRWSAEVMDEVQTAIERMRIAKGIPDAAAKAREARLVIEAAFEDAKVTGYDRYRAACVHLPDPKDIHVVAAALRTRAATIVTDNLKDFPADLLRPLGLEARSADHFIADTIALDEGRAVAVIRAMRRRLKRPETAPGELLLLMEAAGLTATVDILKAHELSL